MAQTTELSIPPLNPTTTPSAPARLTILFTKAAILLSSALSSNARGGFNGSFALLPVLIRLSPAVKPS